MASILQPLRWANRHFTKWLGETAPQVRQQTIRTVYGQRDEAKTLSEKQQDFKEKYDRNLRMNIEKQMDSASEHEKVNEVLRMALMGKGPGWWVSDHAEEAQHFTGWNYTAIHAKAKQAMMATARVYKKVPKKEDRDDEIKKSWENRLGDYYLKSAANPDLPEYDRVPLDEDHPASKLLRKPNPRWIAGIWRYMSIQQMDLTGTALWWKVRDKKNDLSELWVIPYALARPQFPTPNFPEGSYWVTATGLFTAAGGFPTALGIGAMAGLTIDARDVHKAGWPHPVLLADNNSPVASMSVQIDLAEEIDQAAWAVLHNAVDPSVILSLDANMQVEPEVLDGIEAKVNASRAGVAHKGQFWVLQGCKAENVGRSPSELDYADSRQEIRNGVLAGHGVAPIFCGVTEAGSYSAFFAALTQTIEVTVQPELDLLAGELTRLFQEEFEDDSLEVIITAKSFNDPEVTERRRQVNISARSVTINEDRKMMGLEPVPWGDIQIGTPLPPANIDTDLATPGIQSPVPYPEPPTPGRYGGQAPPTQVQGTPGAPELELPDDKPSGTNTGLRKPISNRKPSLNSKIGLRADMNREIQGLKKPKKQEKKVEPEDLTKKDSKPETLRDMLDRHLLNGFHDE